MIFNVILSPDARRIMDFYFDNYQGTGSNNDMLKRAFNYSRTLKCLANFDAYIDGCHIIDNKNCLNIDAICRIEFAKEYDNILIENITFFTNPFAWQL